MKARRQTTIALYCVGTLLGAHIVVPLLWGDVYPFTSAPMFRDRPTQYCDYHVFDAGGKELPQEDWLVHRVYDGNPVGYGVGRRPPPVIEQEFGVVHDADVVRRHFEAAFRHPSMPQNQRHAFVTVKQTSLECTGSGSLTERTTIWQVNKPSR